MIPKNWKSLLLKLFKIFSIIFLQFFVFSVGSKEKKLYLAKEKPHPLKGIEIKEKLGEFIDLNLVFVDEKNQSIPLKNYFRSKPVLMSVIYYNCPSLCNFQIKALISTLEKMSGDKNFYRVLLVSMDESESPKLAKKKKENYFKKFPKLPWNRIHFLTGSRDSIKQLTESLGFSFYWDEETEQFAHSPVSYTLTEKGKISRYIYGIEFEPKTLKLSLLEAGAGKVGNIIDRILLFCYRFNPKENKYTLYAVNIMKLGGLLMVLSLLSLLFSAWFKERRKHY